MIPSSWGEPAGTATLPAAPAPARNPTAADDDMASPSVLDYSGRSTGVVQLTAGGLEMLRQTKPWVTFISGVMAVVGLLLLAFAGWGLIVSSSKAGGFYRMPIFGVYLLVALVYLAVGSVLRKYATRLKELMNTQGPEQLEAAMGAQRTFWRLAGILIAIFVALYGVVLLMAFGSLTLRRLFR
jgi:hypothetical protein